MGPTDRGNRRQFLAGLGRGLLACGLGLGVTALVARGGKDCLRTGGCEGCALIGKCDLGQAQDYRNRTQRR